MTLDTLCAGLAGSEYGPRDAAGPAFVFVHGLTFDRSMWDPVARELPEDRRAIAFDLPGHGGSIAPAQPGLAAVVEAIHEAVLEARIEQPIVIGHSIGGPIAAIYAATHPAAGVVSIDAPLRVEAFAEQLVMLRPQLEGAAFAQTWERFRASWRIDLVPVAQQAFLRDRPSQQLVLGYQSDVLDRPLADLVAWRDAGLRRLRENGTPYLALQSDPIDPDDGAWLAARLPQAETAVWPVGHHFPHLDDPKRFAALLTRFAAGAGH